MRPPSAMGPTTSPMQPLSSARATSPQSRTRAPRASWQGGALGEAAEVEEVLQDEELVVGGHLATRRRRVPLLWAPLPRQLQRTRCSGWGEKTSDLRQEAREAGPLVYAPPPLLNFPRETRGFFGIFW